MPFLSSCVSGLGARLWKPLPQVTLRPIYRAFATCEGLKRFIWAGRPGRFRTGAGGAPSLPSTRCCVAIQIYTVPGSSQHSGLSWELTKHPGSSWRHAVWSKGPSTKNGFPCPHLHLMSSSFPLRTSPRAVASGRPLFCVCRVPGRASF